MKTPLLSVQTRQRFSPDVALRHSGVTEDNLVGIVEEIIVRQLLVLRDSVEAEERCDVIRWLMDDSPESGFERLCGVVSLGIGQFYDPDRFRATVRMLYPDLVDQALHSINTLIEGPDHEEAIH